MAGTELATAYVSLVVDTKKIPGQINTAMNGVQAQADSAGKGMGSRLASGIGSTFKLGAAAVGAAAGLAIGTALSKGFERVVSIDDAKGKLAGLGHSVEGISTIMDSALKSVKGTAFGMGDAATVAASAVAAGIKPGEELTKYLSLTGDAATIAGASLGEMGSIFNKVQTSGKAYTDNLNQLSDRGIPIFQWLQEEYGVSAEALNKMVKEGKVDSETFQKVIRENIGGAALESGKTLRGSFENMKAALGRIGAGAIEPFLPMLKNGLNKVTEWADLITPKVKVGAQFVADGLMDMGRAFQSSGESIEGPASNFEKFGVKARFVADGIKGVFSILKDGKFSGSKMTFGLDENSGVVETLFKIRETALGVYNILFKGNYTNPVWGQLENSKTVDVLYRIRDGAIALWAAIKSPSGEKFSEFLDTFKSSGDGASGTMGQLESGANTLTGVFKGLGGALAAGGLAIAKLGGDTATVAVVGIKMLGGVMGFLANHTGAATTAIAGLAAAVAVAKTVHVGFEAARVAQTIMMPAQIAATMALTRATVEQAAVQRAYLTTLGAEVPVAAQTLRQRIASTIARQREAVATATAASSLTAYAAAQRAAAASSGLMGANLRNAAAGFATFGARVQGVATAGFGALRSGIGSVMSMLGGPWVVGLAAAAAGIWAFKSSTDKVKGGLEDVRNAAQRSSGSFKEYRTKLDEAFSSSGGKVDSGVRSVVKDQIEGIQSDLNESADKMPSLLDKAFGWTNTINQFNPFSSGARMFSGAGASKDDVNALEDAATAAQETQTAFDALGITNRDLATGVSGSTKDWDELKARMDAGGVGVQSLNDKYTKMRQEFVESQTSASQIKDAFAEINSGAINAAGGVDALTSAFERWRGDQLTVEDAQQRVNDALRSFGEAAAAAGADVIDASGKIDTTTAAGSQLYSAVKQVQSAFDEAGAAAYQAAIDMGQSPQQAAAASEAAGQRIRDEFIRQQVESGVTLEKAIALADQYKLFPKEIPTQIRLSGVEEARSKLLELLKPEEKQIYVKYWQNQDAFNNSGQQGPVNFLNPDGNADGGRLPRNSQGSRLPTTGPGTDRTDGILGVGRDGTPTTWVDKGEWIINGRSSSKWDWLLGMINRDDSRLRNLPKFEKGGRNGIQAALDAGRSVQGHKYLWGGSGPDRFDCSGFVGWLQQIAMGIVGSVQRLYTTYSLLSGTTAGLEPGLGPAGTLFQVGVSQEHMAATIAGKPAESGGSHGDSRIGSPAVGATDPQFGTYFHLPNEKIAGFSEGMVSGYSSGSRSSTRKKVEWSDKNQLDLESAQVSVTQAEESLAEVQAKFNEGKKSQADLDQANLKVQKAQNKVVELQKKKDDAAAGVDEGPAPQAPELEKAYSDAEKERIRAQLAVNEANERRNEVYADFAAGEASEDDKLKADVDLAEAQEKLAEAGKSKDKSGSSDGSGDYSLKGILKTFAGRMVDAGFSALEGQDPFGITQSRWWSTDFTKTGSNGEVASDSSSQAEIDGQLPVTPGTPGWLEGLLRTGDFKGGQGVEEDDPAVIAGLAANSLSKGDFTENVRNLLGVEEDNPIVGALLKHRGVKVYDSGGWLKPGEMGINLSNRPEPIFNSPEQLKKFAGGLEPGSNGGGQSVDNSININGVTVADINEFRAMLNVEQRKRALTFNRR